MAKAMHGRRPRGFLAVSHWAYGCVGACLLTLALVVGAFAATPSFAYADEAADSSLSLTVRDRHDGISVRGVGIRIFRVAEIADDGTLNPVGDFVGLPVDWDVEDEADARVLANTLEAFVMRDGIEPTDAAYTDANGMAPFPSGAALEPGYYLILADGHDLSGKVYRPMASLVALPYMQEDGTAVYAPVASLKCQACENVDSLDVTKVWLGENPDQPAEVTVQLLRDGEVYRTAILNKSNGWHVKWTGLGAQYMWSVLEDPIPEGYIVSVKNDNGIVVVTNIYSEGSEDSPNGPENPNEPDNPSDGPDGPEGDEPSGPSDGSGTPGDGTDSSSSSGQSSSTLPQTGQLWWPVAALLVAGVVLLGAGLVRKSRG